MLRRAADLGAAVGEREMTGMDRIVVWPENGNGADAGNIDATETINTRSVCEHQPEGTAYPRLSVRSPSGQAGGLSMANHIGWECAWELANTHAARLIPAQHIACAVTTMRHPDRASLEFIALACRVMGKRT